MTKKKTTKTTTAIKTGTTVPKNEKTKAVITELPLALLAEIDAWCAAHGVEGEPVSRSGGVRALLRTGLRADASF